ENGFFYGTEIHFKVHEKLQYKCNPGYHTPSGNTTEAAVCLTHGWSHTPYCTSIEVSYCTSPPVIKNGVLLGPLLTSYKNGSSVEYGCQHYHFLDGPSTVYCEQGNWSEKPTCLEPCTLNVTDMNRNNIELKWRQEELIFLHGDLIEFECKQGYNFLYTTIPSPGRTQCNHGRLTYPKCIMQGKTILLLLPF
uniref:Coagulation factor XIII B chain n=1 Tax=Athene cunicularia TaxID=194338 RepID=A0A663LPF9_ATHCN